MTDWTPEVSIMTEDRHLLLQLVKLCKKYEIESQAVMTAAVTMTADNSAAIDLLQDEIGTQRKIFQPVVDRRYLRLETAIADGSPFLPLLKTLLERHPSVS